MLQVIGLSLLGVLLALTVKKVSPEQGFLLSLVVSCAILIVIWAFLNPVIDYVSELASAAMLDDAILSPLLKVTGIAILTRITSELCRDAKEQGIAAGVETGGAVIILFVSMPLFSAVLKLMKTLI